MNPDRPRIGISACLLGQPTRYDGGHKHQPTLCEALAAHLELVPLCPEAALGIPRPPVRLVQTGNRVQALTLDIDTDVTEQLLAFPASRRSELDRLCGFVLKARSPSCGLGSTPHFTETGEPHGTGDGLFAAFVRTHYPDVPLSDEENLQDEEKRQHFLAAVRETARQRRARDNPR